MTAPSFESHQCLAGMWKRWLSCHAGRQEVGRCHTRGESQGTCNITCTPPLSLNKAEPTLALKPRGDITRSPKQGYQWPHKKDSCPPKISKKKEPIRSVVTAFVTLSIQHLLHICHGFVSAGDALGREHPATPMLSFLAGHSGCK